MKRPKQSSMQESERHKLDSTHVNRAPSTPPLAPKLCINGQNDVNVDINIKIMIIKGSIFDDYFS